MYLEPISKIRLEFRARRGSVKKRSIHVVCEHFEPLHNAVMDTKIVFEIGYNNNLKLCSLYILRSLNSKGVDP